MKKGIRGFLGLTLALMLTTGVSFADQLPVTNETFVGEFESTAEMVQGEKNFAKMAIKEVDGKLMLDVSAMKGNLGLNFINREGTLEDGKALFKDNVLDGFFIEIFVNEAGELEVATNYAGYIGFLPGVYRVSTEKFVSPFYPIQ